MKFVTYNIQYGLGKDDRYDLARIAREVEAADVIALQEVERHWQRSGCVDAPAVLGSYLPENHWVFRANLALHASYRDRRGAVGSLAPTRAWTRITATPRAGWSTAGVSSARCSCRGRRSCPRAIT